MPNILEPHLQADVDAIGSISIVPQMLEVICRTTGMGFSAIARVTEDKWITCSTRDKIAFGLIPGSELKLETTICNEIRQHLKPVIINQVSLDDQFCDHHTPAMYGFESYISMPIIRKDGTFFGTLCAIDPKPAKLNTPEITGMFRLFADLISFHLSAVDELKASENKLKEELETAAMRDKFIAILGHDLLNPVGATLNAAQVLLRLPYDERVHKMSGIIQNSSYRMKALIENVLDFARGSMGEGISMTLRPDTQLEKTLHQVVVELTTMWPRAVIETQIEITETVYCDSRRIAQLFSNLLGNAITHGQKDTPIKVNAITDHQGFELRINNEGNKIPEAAMARLFQPFSRGEVNSGKQGLGLGLYIASEIAKTHNGTLTVQSDDEETSFTLRIPKRQTE